MNETQLELKLRRSELAQVWLDTIEGSFSKQGYLTEHVGKLPEELLDLPIGLRVSVCQ